MREIAPQRSTIRKSKDASYYFICGVGRSFALTLVLRFAPGPEIFLIIKIVKKVVNSYLNSNNFRTRHRNYNYKSKSRNI